MKKLFSLIILTALTSAIHAQVQVDETMTPEELVQQVLLGEGVEVFNVQFNGFDGTQVNNQIGRYIGPSNFIDFDEGIVMASGGVIQVTGGFEGPDVPASGDQDLYDVANASGTSFSVNNQAILEFDFIPEGDSLTIRYVFTSQEYPGFTCSNYNDPFGFFISGPGITGPYSNNAQNIAVIPGSDTPIAVNTINGGVPTGGGTVQNCLDANPNFVEDSQYFVDNDPPQPDDVQFPGMTVTLTARAAVVCGEIYHIKLAIADVSDGALDSGVFLEKGGFQAAANVSIDASPVNNGIQVGGNDFTDGVLAGCTNAEFCLSRDDTVGVDTSYFSIGGTATAGVQYILPTEEYVIFEEGEDTICFEIQTLANELGAQVDSIEFSVFVIDDCTGDTVYASASIAVYNEYSFDIATEDVTITCPTELVELEALASNGISPYSYSWALESDPGTEIGQGTSIAVEPPGSGQSQTYIITVDDDCGITTETTTVTLFDETVADPEVVITPQDASINCVGQTVELTAFGTNGQGDLEYVWTTGDETPTTTVAPDGSQTTTYYTVFVTDECGVMAIDSVGVDFIPLENPVANAGEDVTVVCAGDEVEINATATGGAAPYEYTWVSLPSGPSHTVSPLVTTTYYLTVTDDCQGTSEMDSIVVTVPVYEPIAISLPSPTSVCPGDEHILAADVSGGAGIYTYEWDTGSNNSSIVVSPDQVGFYDYEVTVTDQCGASNQAETLVTVPVYDPVVVTPSSRPSCTGESFTLSVATVSGGAGDSDSDYLYAWTDANGNLIEGVNDVGSVTLNNFEPGTYSVLVSDACGNSGTADVQANLFGVESIPNIITPGDTRDANDQFIVPGSDIFDTRLTILDRWGKVVFETDKYVCDRALMNDPTTLIDLNCWEAEDVKGDVFYYIINIDNGACTFQGTLHVADTQ